VTEVDGDVTGVYLPARIAAKAPLCATKTGRVCVVERKKSLKVLERKEG
jgi:hypothetical protein